ncbi:MAG: hypothetical protein D3922_16905, partial [Candidatus Electrothrix sp. AR1]|nr:hypothetical protein [Candidatus Electrothrix sp. AR1]
QVGVAGSNLGLSKQATDYDFAGTKTRYPNRNRIKKSSFFSVEPVLYAFSPLAPSLFCRVIECLNPPLKIIFLGQPFSQYFK